MIKFSLPPNSLFFPVLLIFCFTVFHSLLSFSQSPGEWTWMHGDTMVNPSGIFGTQGVFDAVNHPPGLYEAGEWTDLSGNFWLFGGQQGADYNALWQFDPSINQWAWMKGSSTFGQPGNYGVLGVPSPSNTPGSRLAFTTWMDTSGNLWLYGGYGYGATSSGSYLDDVWKYDMATNEWTWMAGSSSSVTSPTYGTLGVFSASNTPGGRLESDAAFVGDDGNFWLFGGQLSLGYVGDLWKFDLSLNQWAWMKGPTGVYLAPVYGTLGVPDPNNHPGGRRIYTNWKDENGNFYLYAGQSSSSCYSDLWMIDPDSLEWVWVSGSSNLNTNNNNHGNVCEIDSSYFPGARMENRFSWRDDCNRFWNFGGLNTSSGKYFNDLWVYDPLTNEWSWVSGSPAGNQTAWFGTLGVSDPMNRPGSRYGGAAFKDTAGNFWVWGGVGYASFNSTGTLNDLWKYVPDSACHGCKPLPSGAFFSSTATVCEKFCIDFFDASSNNPTSWLWEFPGGVPSSSSDQNPAQICYNNPGTFDVTLIITSATGSDTLTIQDYITVYPTPPFPVITQNGNILTSSPAAFYQWQLNSIDISGATSQSYEVTQSGFYTVVISDSNGCQNSASIKVELTGIESLNNTSVSVYPNPSNGILYIELFNLPPGEIEIEILNSLGQAVIYSEEKNTGTHFAKDFDLNELPAGVYVLRIKSLPFLQKIILQE